MSPLELLVMLVILYWVARQLLSDGWNLLRGRGAAPRRGGGSGRYGVRGYFADRWSDGWETATERRRARRTARAARRAAGEPRFPRLARGRAALSAWYRDQGGSREYHRRGNQVTEEIRPGALDRAWDRWEQRRAERAARRAAGEPDGRRGRDVPDGADPRVAQPPQAPVGEPSRPTAGDDASASPQHDQDAHRVPLDATPNGERRHGDTDPGAGAAPERGGDAAPPSTPAPGRHNHNHKEGNGMAEATGLTSSINYAGAQSEAAYSNVTEVEQWLASLQAHEVSGETIEAGRQAMEQYQAAGASFARAQAALQRHLQVKEAYDANQDAGDRQFVTSE